MNYCLNDIVYQVHANATRIRIGQVTRIAQKSYMEIQWAGGGHLRQILLQNVLYRIYASNNYAELYELFN